MKMATHYSVIHKFRDRGDHKAEWRVPIEVDPTETIASLAAKVGLRVGDSIVIRIPLCLKEATA